MVTPCKFPTARDVLRVLRTIEARGQVDFFFVLEKGCTFHLHRALAGRSNPVGCWHFAVALTHALQKRPSPHAGQAGGRLAQKGRTRSQIPRSPKLPLFTFYLGVRRWHKPRRGPVSCSSAARALRARASAFLMGKTREGAQPFRHRTRFVARKQCELARHAKR